MDAGTERLSVVKKEMGLTHQEFFDKLPVLLNAIPYQHSKDCIRFQFNQKNIEIILEAEGVRELSSSMRRPVTFVTLRFFDFSEGEIGRFVEHFNRIFLKGGG